VLYSALDAYVREFEVRVVSDCTIPLDEKLAGAALEMMRRNLHAEVTDAASHRRGAT